MVMPTIGWFLRASVHSHALRVLVFVRGAEQLLDPARQLALVLGDADQRGRLARAVVDGLPQADRRTLLRPRERGGEDGGNQCCVDEGAHGVSLLLWAVGV
jgi:hypothetical protein